MGMSFFSPVSLSTGEEGCGCGADAGAGKAAKGVVGLLITLKHLKSLSFCS